MPEASYYYNDASVRRKIADGGHRALIGGLWEEMGAWQFNLMRSVGLAPDHRFLDVGCGSFRGGVRFVPYLQPGRYFGFDLNQALIDVGYEQEIVAAGLGERLPRENLAATDEFDCAGFGGDFDFALAVSVFTHLPLNHMRLAFERLAPELKPGGRFVFTYFECPEPAPTAIPITQPPAGVVTYAARDPYHYRRADIIHAAAGAPLEIEWPKAAPHPRGQKVAVAVRA